MLQRKATSRDKGHHCASCRTGEFRQWGLERCLSHQLDGGTTYSVVSEEVSCNHQHRAPFQPSDAACVDCDNIELYQRHGSPRKQEAGRESKSCAVKQAGRDREPGRISKEKATIPEAPGGGAGGNPVTRSSSCVRCSSHGSRF